jgi:chromate transporter
LRDALVVPGWISDSSFRAGYGAAASVPPGGIVGAAIALIAIFLPGILLLLGA